MTLRLTTSDRATAALRIAHSEPGCVLGIIDDPAADRDIAERLRILLTKSEIQERVALATRLNSIHV